MKSLRISCQLFLYHTTVLPERLDCDYYRFLQGDPAAVNAFQNDYMAAYSWAEIRNAELGFKME